MSKMFTIICYTQSLFFVFPINIVMRESANLKDTIISGGVAGFIADTIMHSLDTVKTRMQGQLTSPSYNKISPQYAGLKQSYLQIFKQEGTRGLYSGYISASVGSALSTAIHFGIYENVKYELIALGVNPYAAYFVAGAVGDVFSAACYVPSETRMQLQGVYNNQFSISSHNYHDTSGAIKSVYNQRGFKGMYKGFGDVPYTAIQFLLYETFKNETKKRNGIITQYNEMLSGALAGIIAGGVTTPLDVIKTYLQTQRPLKKQTFVEGDVDGKGKIRTKLPSHRPTYYSGIISAAKGIYETSGGAGLFSGATPRMIWTGSQSMIMFLLYEQCLKYIAREKV